MWSGESSFVLRNLIAKDFRVRYRNMSLGMFWSILNPLVMMLVLTFVFTRIFPSTIPNFAVFALCGLVPFTFFSIAWTSGTTSLVDNASVIKRVPVPRHLVPIAAVLSNCLHLAIQILLLAVIIAFSGISFNRYWVWLPLVWLLEVVFLCGLALLFSAINVYIRDTRYIVESASVVLWWLVPIVYDFAIIPQQYREIYLYNPVAALVMAMRLVILQAQPPGDPLLIKLTLVSAGVLVLGWSVFKLLERRFYSYL